jgi:hypothetical protein
VDDRAQTRPERRGHCGHGGYLSPLRKRMR